MWRGREYETSQKTCQKFELNSTKKRPPKLIRGPEWGIRHRMCHCSCVYRRLVLNILCIYVYMYIYMVVALACNSQFQLPVA
jgi:hypothetical protein